MATYPSNQYWEQAGFDEATDAAADMTTEQVRLAVAGAQTGVEAARDPGRRHQCLGRLRGYRQALLAKEVAAPPAAQRATVTVAFEWTAGAGWNFNTTDMAPEACLALRGRGEDTEVLDMLAEFFDAACVRLDEQIGDPGMAAPLSTPS